MLVMMVASMGGAGAETYVQEDIASDIHWNEAGSPYYVDEIIYVEAGSTLTIGPNVVVLFAPGAGIVVNGALIVEGASLEAYGDEMSDADDQRWFFEVYGDMQIINCVVSGAYEVYLGESSNVEMATTMIDGAYGHGIRVDGCSPIIRGCTISNSTMSGIHIDGGSPSIIDCTIVGNDRGIFAFEASLDLVVDNIIMMNAEVGIYAENVAGVIHDNVFLFNGVELSLIDCDVDVMYNQFGYGRLIEMNEPLFSALLQMIEMLDANYTADSGLTASDVSIYDPLIGTFMPAMDRTIGMYAIDSIVRSEGNEYGKLQTAVYLIRSDMVFSDVVRTNSFDITYEGGSRTLSIPFTVYDGIYAVDSTLTIDGAYFQVVDDAIFLENSYALVTGTVFDAGDFELYLIRNSHAEVNGKLDKCAILDASRLYRMGKLTINVIDQDGFGIAGASVIVKDASGNIWSEGMTDRDGVLMAYAPYSLETRNDVNDALGKTLITASFEDRTTMVEIDVVGNDELTLRLNIAESANVHIVDGELLLDRPVFPEGLSIGTNLWIIDDGILIVNSTTLTIVQSFDEQFQIIVSGNGMLVLENGATLQSAYAIDLILRDDAQLIVNGSTLSPNVRIIAEGNSKLTFNEATVGQSITAPSGSGATVNAINTTFGQAWTGFGGDAEAYLTNVKAPSLAVKDNAIIHIYRWLTVTAKDGNGHALAGAHVAVTMGDMRTPYAEGMTNLNGAAWFEVEVAQLVAGKPATSIIGYYVNTTYWHDGQAYEGDSHMFVNMIGYTAPLLQASKAVDLKISTAVPDIDPLMIFDDENPVRGQEIVIRAHIANNGPVDAYDVRVLFKDNTTGEALYSAKVPFIPKGGQDTAVNVTFSWTAVGPVGDHEILLSVDPYEEIKEVDKANNNSTRSITVGGIIDLSVVDGSVAFDPAVPAATMPALVEVKIMNHGDIAAAEVLVRLYAAAPDGVEVLVGTKTIASLGVNGTVLVNFLWTPAVSGMHALRVEVDEGEDAPNITREDNELTFTKAVVDLPDLSIISDDLIIGSGPIARGDEITAIVTVHNNGLANASSFVEFYEAGVFLRSIPVTVPANSSVDISFSWTAGQEGTYSIRAVVNADGTVKELSSDNNEAAKVITVDDKKSSSLGTSPLVLGIVTLVIVAVIVGAVMLARKK